MGAHTNVVTNHKKVGKIVWNFGLFLYLAKESSVEQSLKNKVLSISYKKVLSVVLIENCLPGKTRWKKAEISYFVENQFSR